MPVDELNAVILLILLIAVLAVAALYGVIRMAIAYRRDKVLRYDWRRAIRAALRQERVR